MWGRASHAGVLVTICKVWGDQRSARLGLVHCLHGAGTDLAGQQLAKYVKNKNK